MGWDGFGKLEGTIGQKAVTPVLDSLAKTGITFNNLWVNPVCSPTRATILTGKYAYHTGVGAVVSPQSAGLSASEIILQKYINTKTDNAYASAIIGKWHVSNNSNLTAPEDFGLDYFSGIFGGAINNYYSWTKTSGGQQTTITTYATSYLVDESKQWIAKQTKPWFLWLSLNAPHTPFHRPPLNLISDKSLSGTASVIAANPLPYYLAAIEAMDAEIGRLINGLTEAQKSNTLIVFIGDNGTPANAIQLPYSAARAKESLFQGGINTPLIASGFGVNRKNQIDYSLVNGTDLFATIADVAGAGVSRVNDGYSLKEEFNTSGVFSRKYAFSELFGSGTSNDGWAIRDSKYKLIHLENGDEYFYNLISDPFESNNLLSSSLSAEAAQALSSLRSEQLKLQ